MASFSAISLDTTSILTQFVSPGRWAIVPLPGIFQSGKRVTRQRLSSRHDMRQSGFVHLRGRDVLPPEEHPEVIRLILTHFVTSLPDILSARDAERAYQHGERAPLPQRQVMWQKSGAEIQ